MLRRENQKYLETGIQTRGNGQQALSTDLPGAGDAVASKYPAATLTPKKALDGQWPKQKVAEFKRYETCSNSRLSSDLQVLTSI